MSAAKFSAEEVDRIGSILNDSRNLKDDRSVYWIGKALSDPSALLKHELAYCLGQMRNPTAIPVLIQTLEDVLQEPMVRHEAGEALGAIGDPSVCEILEKYCNDSMAEVAETCQLALRRIQWLQNNEENANTLISGSYDSVDPTPATSSSNIEELSKILVDATKPLWDRYRAMFTLRNINTDESIKALAQGLYCEDSALFRHEVAYVLGQIQSPLVVKELTDRLRKVDENCMVRHECAEALGAIASPECQKILEEYVKDSERVVRESCEVALDMLSYENSDEFQYAAIKS
uniref:Deoxyhypusine hydroxylase n=1 Tax=Acrobeloides nanus TaxID=290746 RepID=A0A914CVY3_9BILA